MKRGNQDAALDRARRHASMRTSLGGVLHDVAHVLQSAKGFRLRVLRTFELLRELVPYDRCAVLESPPGGEPCLVTQPELAPDARIAHHEMLVGLLERLALGPVSGPRAVAEGAASSLAVTLFGLDGAIGVLHVDCEEGSYTARHRLALSLVGAQLGAYLTMVRSSARDQSRDDALEEARRSEAAAIREKDELLALVAKELGAGRAIVEMLVEPEGGCPTCAGPDEASASPAAGSARSTGDTRALAGISVLLVDDDFDIRDAFQLVLEEYGAEVRPAESAAAALAVLATWRPDVLLSDLAMPGQSGYELMQRVAARVDAPPAAALTAYATREGRELALAAGFRLYVGKPLDSTDLIEMVAVLAGRRASTHAIGEA